MSLIVSVLSLLVATVAVLVTWANVRWQNKATAAEAWMREFRGQAAAILTNRRKRPGEGAREMEVYWERLLSYHTMRLLIAEKGPRHEGFLPHLESMWQNERPGESNFDEEFTAAAAEVLRREREASLSSLRLSFSTAKPKRWLGRRAKWQR